MNLVFLYGPLSVGKLAVARALSSDTGYPLFHNHLSLDCVLPLFDYQSPSLNKLVRQIRGLVLEEAAEQRLNLITTFVYAHPQDVGYVREYLDPYEIRGGRVCLVQLTCEKQVLFQRVSMESRVQARKLASAEILRGYLQQYELFTAIPGYESLTIDNTNLPPEGVASRIREHFQI